MRFKEEFRTLNDIDHPNMVRLYELLEEDGHWFFTMELIGGLDLLAYVRADELVLAFAVTRVGAAQGPEEMGLSATRAGREKRQRAFDESRLRTVLKQLAMGVAALHSANKAHRDIKPSNILVTDKERVVLLDFGVVRDLSGEGKSTRGIIGTPEYMAPEQAAGRKVGPAAESASGRVFDVKVKPGWSNTT